jgi:hypothetical protein
MVAQQVKCSRRAQAQIRIMYGKIPMPGLKGHKVRRVTPEIQGLQVQLALMGQRVIKGILEILVPVECLVYLCAKTLVRRYNYLTLTQVNLLPALQYLVP